MGLQKNAIKKNTSKQSQQNGLEVPKGNTKQGTSAQAQICRGRKAKNWRFTLFFAYHNDDEKKKLSDEEKLEDIEITNRLVYIPKVTETNEFDTLDFLQNEEVVSYFIYQIEQCPTSGRLHYQGYVQFKKEKRLTALKKINKRANWGETNGSAESNKKYCSKNDSRIKGPWEKGQLSRSGDRKDLDNLRDDILQGRTTVDDVAVNDPHKYHIYGRTLSKIEDIVLRKKFRTKMTQGYWYFGKTGVGKSHIAYEGFNPETHYNYKAEKGGWWDGYTGQDIVIINDYRGSIPYDELLKMVDKWPFEVPRRNREPVPFLASKIIITSALPPQDVYCNRNENDKIEQLMRRFEVYELLNRNGEKRRILDLNDDKKNNKNDFVGYAFKEESDDETDSKPVFESKKTKKTY